MANYYTGKCSFSKDEWSNVDLTSRQQVIELLSTALSNSVSNIGESQGACSWDVSCTIISDNLSNNIVFELKDRNMTSDKFGDIMVEKDKYDNNKKYCPGFGIIAVNCFKDGIIALCPMSKKYMKISEKYCPATTLLRGCNHKYVKKTVATLPQYLKFKKINNKWRKI